MLKSLFSWTVELCQSSSNEVVPYLVLSIPVVCLKNYAYEWYEIYEITHSWFDTTLVDIFQTCLLCAIAYITPQYSMPGQTCEISSYLYFTYNCVWQFEFLQFSLYLKNSLTAPTKKVSTSLTYKYTWLEKIHYLLFGIFMLSPNILFECNCVCVSVCLPKLLRFIRPLLF